MEQGDRFLAQLEFSFAAYLPDNRLQTYAPIPVYLNLTAAERDQAMRDGIRFGHNLPVGEAVRRVRLLVVDRNSNTTATLTFPVE